MWVARSHRPFSIVNDPDLLDIFRMLYAPVEVPHPTTVSRDVQFIFKQARVEVAKYLQVSLDVQQYNLYIKSHFSFRAYRVASISV